jgi:hypothetical protein
MKLEEKNPMIDTRATNCTGLVRNGKIVNPRAKASIDERSIFIAFCFLSSKPPHRGERIIVSTAGSREIRAMSEKEEPKDRRCMGRKVQTMPIGP